MKEKKISIMRIISPLVIIGIFVGMWFHVTSVKEELENIQTDLIYVEAGRMTRSESLYLNKPESGAYTTSDTIHPEGAYIWAVPYIIIDVVLIILYVVKYRT